MEAIKRKKVLVSGAGIAGLSTAWWLNQLRYKVTVIEQASALRTAGAAIDIKGATVDIVKRMGIFERLHASRLGVDRVEFKHADDSTAGSIVLNNGDEEPPNDDIEVERDILLTHLFDGMKNDVEFIFSNSITALQETKNDIQVTFKDGCQRVFHLVFGCDGLHSIVRKIWFGHEEEYVHFLQAYFSITIANKLLVPRRTMHMYNVPDKGIMLNAYNGKTDIIFCFFSETEIPYDYRNIEQQRNIIQQQFAGGNWRTAELLNEAEQATNFYFDKFCQIKMPSWTKGRVALLGDAGYCASPAAGMGASLSITGAAALADALRKQNGDFESAFGEYNQSLRPFIEEVQATAEFNIKENFIPRTEEAIRKRIAQTAAF